MSKLRARDKRAHDAITYLTGNETPDECRCSATETCVLHSPTHLCRRCDPPSLLGYWQVRPHFKWHQRQTQR